MYRSFFVTMFALGANLGCEAYHVTGNCAQKEQACTLVYKLQEPYEIMQVDISNPQNLPEKVRTTRQEIAQEYASFVTLYMNDSKVQTNIDNYNTYIAQAKKKGGGSRAKVLKIESEKYSTEFLPLSRSSVLRMLSVDPSEEEVISAVDVLYSLYMHKFTFLYGGNENQRELYAKAYNHLPQELKDLQRKGEALIADIMAQAQRQDVPPHFSVAEAQRMYKIMRGKTINLEDFQRLATGDVFAQRIIEKFDIPEEPLCGIKHTQNTSAEARESTTSDCQGQKSPPAK